MTTPTLSAFSDFSPAMMRDAVAQAAIMVDITSHTWCGKVTAREMTTVMERQMGIVEGSGAYSKDLFRGTNALKEVKAVQTAFRKYVEARTLPMAGTSYRLLANVHIPEFMHRLAVAQDEVSKALDRLEAQYDNAKEVAKRNLGPAYNADDYLPMEEIRHRFAITCDIHNVPHAEAFGKMGMIEGAFDGIRDRVNDVLDARMKLVVEDLVDRARVAANKVRERMVALQEADPEGRQPALFESVFINCADTGLLMSDYASILGSDTLAEIAASLCEIGAMKRDEVRDNPRKQAQAELAAYKILASTDSSES